MSDMDVSWPFLAWSAISVGKAELLHIVRYEESSLFAIAYRATHCAGRDGILVELGRCGRRKT
jgi:hypothetical protein